VIHNYKQYHLRQHRTKIVPKYAKFQALLEIQIFVRLYKFDAGILAVCKLAFQASLEISQRCGEVVQDDGKYASRFGAKASAALCAVLP